MKFLNYCFLSLSILALTNCDSNEDPTPNPDPPLEVITRITEDRTLTADGDWTLDGLVYVENNAVLTIEPGATLKFTSAPGTGDNASALIITRGAKIMAEGTADLPIVLTSTEDDGSLTSADNSLWGGLILLGRSKVFAEGETELGIEGIDDSELRAKYGGDDVNDNSGVISYVSIRHTGIGLAPGDEIQGLTLGAVGTGTAISYVEIYGSSDDGIEFFGGTVDIKYAAIIGAEDDSFDWDLGYRGTGNQYWFAIQREDAGDHLSELDGAKPDGADLYSNPTVRDFTLVGSSNTENMLIFRDATAGTWERGVIAESGNKGLEVEDLPAAKGIDSYQRLLNGELKLREIVWSNIGGAESFAAMVQATDGGDGTEENGGRTEAIIAELEVNCSIDNGVISRDNPAAGNRGAFVNGDWTTGWTAYSNRGI